MNIEARERYLKQCGANLQKRIGTANAKQLVGLIPEAERLAFEWKKLEAHRQAQGSSTYAALRCSGMDLGSEPEVTEKRVTGRELSPLSFTKADLKAGYEAFKNRTPISIQTKAFSTVESLLPPQLSPEVVAHIHEWRILSHLPAITITAPSYEYIVHNFAGDTGAPGVVAEGGTKPEYVPASSSQIATAVKIAVNTGISYEALMDAPQWENYIQSEVFAQMVDAENVALLNSSSGFNGFFQTSGILSHNCATDSPSWTAVDSIEAAITQMRTGTALSDPDLLIVHPNAWAAIRRTKSSTNNYVVGDPLSMVAEAPPQSTSGRLWGIPVLVTTAMSTVSTSSGLLIDSKRFGNVLIREGIVMHTGYSGTDFVQNIVRYVFESRFALAVVRPQAVLALSNLPVV
jgi:HK97 family phage major capsid protein